MDRNAFIYVFVPIFAAVLFFAVVLKLSLGTISSITFRQGLYYFAAVPIIEEYVFRVLIQGGIYKRYGSLTAANTAASVIFSLCHLLFYPPLTAASVFFPSMVLGYVYGKTASYISVIFIHAVFNMNIFITYQSGILGKFF